MLLGIDKGGLYVKQQFEIYMKNEGANCKLIIETGNHTCRDNHPDKIEQAINMGSFKNCRPELAKNWVHMALDAYGPAE
jgi:hypothetical protein